MFPNNSTSVILGQSIVSEEANLAFFIPDGIHNEADFTSFEELKLNSISMDVTVEKISQLKYLFKYDFIIFPYLNVSPKKSRADFATMCNNLFTKMAMEGVKFDENVKIIFSGNIE